MKKLLLPLLAVLLFMACKKEIATDKATEEFAVAAANRTSPKITIWHYDASTGKWKQISINATAWSEHQTHGDIRKIGDDYQGGKIAYILQLGDPGYDANTPHGLIAAASDQSPGVIWYNNLFIVTGATGTALGTGLSNTNSIVAAQGAGIYAASLCADLVLNGYGDWYLPSVDELNKLYINQVAIGGFASAFYWSSTEFSTQGFAYYQIFYNGVQALESVWQYRRVRAVRAF